nr:MAG TPA: hypothetical protein [Caudoviricetes sp.]
MIWLPNGQDLRPSDSVSLPTTRRRCWKSTGRTCRAGGISGR